MALAGSGSARLATPADAARLAELLDAFNREFDVPSLPVPVLAGRLEALLATDGTFAVVCDDPITSFGLVTLRTNVWFAGRVGLLDELYVEPALRGGGRGTALLALVEAECGRRGVDHLEINVDEPDVDAIRFYERHGYACGTGPGELELYFSKTFAEG